MKQIALIVWLLAAAQLSLKAQQPPIFSQFATNLYLVNPASAGYGGYADFAFNAREQYSGFVNPPRTFTLSAQTRLQQDGYLSSVLPTRLAERLQRVGVGGVLFADNNGRVSRTGFQLTYAYHLELNPEAHLSMGLSLTGHQFAIRGGDHTVIDPNDPLVYGQSFFTTDANAGVFFAWRDLFAGLSGANLMGSYFKFGRNQLDDFRANRLLYLMAGYSIDLSDDLMLRPSMLLQTSSMHTWAEVNVTLYYILDYWVGFSYRTNGKLVSMAGVSLGRFYVGYSFDASFARVAHHTAGSHEIILGYRLRENPRSIGWLNRWAF